MPSLKKIGTIYYDNNDEIHIVWKRNVTFQKKKEIRDKNKLFSDLKKYADKMFLMEWINK